MEEKKQFTCKDCNYYYKDKGKEYLCCHFQSIADWDLAPCEIDESIYEQDDEYDYDYDEEYENEAENGCTRL